LSKPKSAKVDKKTETKSASQRPAVASSGEYADSWRQLEKVRFTLLWITVLGTFVGGSFGLFFVVGANPIKTASVAALVWIVMWTWSVVRYLRWRCPRCHKVWQSKANGSGTSLIPRESCPHCGLTTTVRSQA
jgi:hypothetical protein